MMTPNELRQRFLQFFEERDHRVVASSPVVPQADPTLLFTNAGMNQFKDLLLGNETRDYTRAASVQKCVRAGGKHNDLDEVGRDGRHLTFFEMLGNWSFGDYYKRESIKWAWKFVLEELKLAPERLYVTIYKDDDECFDIWTQEMGLDPARVLRLGDIEAGDEENFWSMGPTGPCGPCTEIHYDLHPEYGPMTFGVGYDEDRINEIWNLVFMEFNRDEDGTLNPLPMKSVDTGLGLDRAAMVVAGRDNVFHTDLFTPIFQSLFELLGQDVGRDLDAFYKSDNFTDYAVIADHVRTVTFAICDGAKFANDGRGYVLRRILRRAVRHGRNLGFDAPFLHRVAAAVVEAYGDIYPELRATGQEAAELIRLEEERFFRNLDRGLELFEDAAARAESEGKKTLSGQEVFQLHATFGFPPDLTEIMAEERGMSIDWESYESLWKEHQETSRGKDMYADAAGVGDWETLEEGPANTFVGYGTLETHTTLRKVRRLPENRFEVLLASTPFYAESGGQVGDRGQLLGHGGELVLEVEDVQKAPIGITHRVRLVTGEPDFTGEFIARVDPRHRQKVACNHTATHLLHAALRDEVDNAIFQAGSMVGPDRLRFDFSYGKPLSADDIQRLEERVNGLIRQRLDVTCHTEVDRDTAVDEMGAMAIFGEKYGDKVRVVEIPGESVELCGGTHVANTGEIALFRITSESSVAAGIRRIEALTEEGALKAFQQERAQLRTLAEIFKSDVTNLNERARAVLEDRSRLEREVDSLSQKLASRGADTLVDDAAEVDGVKVIATAVATGTRDQLMAYADNLREKLGQTEAVALLASEIEGKAALICVVTDAAFKARKVKAGDLIKRVASHVDGRGGGRPTLAQAGGQNPAGIPAAVEAFEGAVQDALS
ncbi:alanine--tRNA ligase [Lujinxingia litoralis]|uniref:Alanine--tRNA ligase n=1 Tax=Lujinxingia litoralis TaxID=2211119 RepID=A0A328CD60_9DELT|nr:alanine--tRNA ligase [Lujinxingia litoralis]RAL25271.1 alanine--tRNA ligase [Lujinxingia litoralis]